MNKEYNTTYQVGLIVKELCDLVDFDEEVCVADIIDIGIGIHTALKKSKIAINETDYAFQSYMMDMGYIVALAYGVGYNAHKEQ